GAMSPYLEHLARRVVEDPSFLAAALAEYARGERLDDAGLAARLGCPPAALVHLRLCGMPRPEAPLFWQDVERIAGRFGVDAAALAEVVRRSQALLRLRAAGGAGDRGKSFLLAARDGAEETAPPEGKGP